MRNITAYLHFQGNAHEAMSYYKSVLGGEFSALQRYKDVPGGEKMSREDQEKVIHISLQISSSLIIMASDHMAGSAAELHAGNNYHICLHTDSENETERLFEGLSKGGKVEMPLNKTFWGAFFGMCRDRYGIHWMVNYLPA